MPFSVRSLSVGSWWLKRNWLEKRFSLVFIDHCLSSIISQSGQRHVPRKRQGDRVSNWMSFLERIRFEGVSTVLVEMDRPDRQNKEQSIEYSSCRHSTSTYRICEWNKEEEGETEIIVEEREQRTKHDIVQEEKKKKKKKKRKESVTIQ